MSWRERLGRNWGRLGMKFDTIKLSELAEIQTGPFGSQLHKEDYVVNGTPIVTVEHLGNRKFTEQNLPCVSDKDKERLKKYMLKTGDIVFSRVGSVDRCSYVSAEYEGWMFSGRCLRVRPCEILNSEYLYYFFSLKETKQFVRNIATGATMPSINTKFMGEVPIRVPSMEAQNKIASILWMIDDKIELNEKINNNLEQQAQLLFKSWFVDFEPFNGTMPSDWEVVPFEKIVDFQNGYAFKSKELLNEPSSDCYQVFKQGHIARGGGFIPDGTKSWYPKKLASKLERFVLKKGDILMAMTDMKNNVAILGNTAIMPIDNEYIVNQRVGHLRVNGYKGITYPFIYLLTNSTDFLIDLRSRANSGVQVNLSSAEIKASQTVLPSEKVNTAFSEITFPMFEAIISNQLENQRLAQLRDTLLPKLMSGELDVSDIDL